MKKTNCRTTFNNSEFKSITKNQQSEIKGGGVNSFMKICGPDINGGSTSKGLETEIEALSWNHG